MPVPSVELRLGPRQTGTPATQSGLPARAARGHSDRQHDAGSHATPPVQPDAHRGMYLTHLPNLAHLPAQVIGCLAGPATGTRRRAAASANSQLIRAKQASRDRYSTTNIVADGSDKSGEASADYGSYRSRPWTRPGSPTGPDRLIDRARTPARKQPTQPDSQTGAASTQIVPEASRRAGTGIRSWWNHRCAICV